MKGARSLASSKKKARRAAPPPAAPKPAPTQASALIPPLALALLLALVPLFRGLYFPMGQLIAAIAVVVIVVWQQALRLQRGQARWIGHPLDWAFLALLAAYLISTFFAANYRDAVQADILDGMAFLVYWLAGERAREPVVRRALLSAFVLGGAAAAVIGVGAGTHQITYNGAFVAGRVYTTFQYPDAAAAYLAAGFIAAIALLGTETVRWRRAVTAALGALLMAVFVFCLSRGALLVLPLALAVLVLLQPKGRRVATTMQMLAVMLPAVAVAFGGRHAMTGGSSVVWLWLIAGMLAAAGLDVVVGRLRARLQAGLLVVGSLATIAGPAILLRHSGGIFGRLGQMNFNDYNAWSRIRWTLDALGIVRDHPVTGLGGGGWAASFQHFQSYGYYSTQVHDFFAQVLVESGVLGGLCLLAAGVVLLVSFVRTWRAAAPETQALLAGVGGAFAMLVLHAAIDFTLSLGAALLAAAALLGILRAHLEPWPVLAEREPAGPVRYSRRMRPEVAGPAVATFGAGIVVVIVLAVLAAGYSTGQTAVAAAQSSQYAQALPLYRQAMGLDPLTASFRGDLAQLTVLTTKSPTQQQIASANALFKQAIGLDRYNAQLHAIYGNFLLHYGQITAGLGQVRTALADAPYQPAFYDQLAGDDLAVAESELSSKHAAGIAPLLAEVDSLQRRLAAVSRSVPAIARPVYPTPATSPQLQLAEAEAQSLRGRWQPATAMLTSLAHASDKTIAGTASAWLAGVYIATGKSGPGAAAAKQSQSLLGATQASALQKNVASWLKLAGA